MRNIYAILHLYRRERYAPSFTVTMAIVAYWMIVAGIVGGLVAAAPFGLIDWLSIPAGTRARRGGQSEREQFLIQRFN